MPTCKGRLENGKPCPKTVKKGRMFCRWHDQEDENWRKDYERLEEAAPEEKAEIILSLIEDHPDHLLILPVRDGLRANLSHINLSRDALLQRKNYRIVNHHSWSEKHASYIANFLRIKGARGDDGSVYLANAFLRGAILAGANLQGAFLVRAYLQYASLSHANLQNADFVNSDLQDADLTAANLQGANLLGANLQNADLHNANLRGANLCQAKLQGVDFSEVQDISGIYLWGAWLDKTRIWPDQLGKIGDELCHDYSGAMQAYLALKQNFDGLGDYESASWAYCRERRMERWEAWKQRNYLKFFSDTLVEWLCDYGESIWRVIVWMAVFLFVIGPLLFARLGGFVWSNELAQDYFALPSFWDKAWFWYYHYLLYTMDTLTTASFSDLRPANDAVKLASGIFAITGIFLTGLLGFVAGNRIRRS